jgi:hypothetical protein
MRTQVPEVAVGYSSPVPGRPLNRGSAIFVSPKMPKNRSKIALIGLTTRLLLLSDKRPPYISGGSCSLSKTAQPMDQLRPKGKTGTQSSLSPVNILSFLTKNATSLTPVVFAWGL